MVFTEMFEMLIKCFEFMWYESLCWAHGRRYLYFLPYLATYKFKPVTESLYTVLASHLEIRPLIQIHFSLRSLLPFFHSPTLKQVLNIRTLSLMPQFSSLEDSCLYCH